MSNGFYTAVVWHVSLKRNIRIVSLVDTRKPGKTGYVVFFSTDVELDAELMLTYYKARFQIEFIFRDAKQFTGLCDAQTRDPKKLDFHFNASLTALNLAKYEVQCSSPQTEPPLPPIPLYLKNREIDRKPLDARHRGEARGISLVHQVELESSVGTLDPE